MTVEDLDSLKRVGVESARKKSIDAIAERDPVADIQEAVIHTARVQKTVIFRRPSGRGRDEFLHAASRARPGQTLDEPLVEPRCRAYLIGLDERGRCAHRELFARASNLEHDFERDGQVRAHRDRCLVRSEPIRLDPHTVLAERHVAELKLAAIVGRREPLEIRGGVVKNDPRLGDSRM